MNSKTYKVGREVIIEKNLHFYNSKNLTDLSCEERVVCMKLMKEEVGYLERRMKALKNLDK